MKKMIMILIYLFVICSISQSQDNELNKNVIINCNGVVFPNSYEEILLIPNDNERFTPTKKDIELSKEVIKSSKPNYYKLLDNTKWYKQFVGYYSDGDKIILVNFLHKKLLRIGKKNEKNWREDFIVGFGKQYEKFRRDITLNITNMTYVR